LELEACIQADPDKRISERGKGRNMVRPLIVKILAYSALSLEEIGFCA